jgi:thiol-disulfide isomerase/thioredoxin
MKNLTGSLIVIIALLMFSGSQVKGLEKTDDKKVIVMVNTAKWCPACKKNGDRVEVDILAQYRNNPNYQIIINDLSTKETKKASEVVYTVAGIAGVAKSNNSTGVIYFINSDTKLLISTISVIKTTEEIKQAFDQSLAKLNK